MDFKVGDIIEGEYETLKILFVGKLCYFCEIVDLDMVGYPAHYEEIGEEKAMCIGYIGRRYGLKK